MKKYNQQNMKRHQKDRKNTIDMVSKQLTFRNMNREDMITMCMPMAEHIALKFPKSEQASGILALDDMLQIGYLAIIKAVDKIDDAILMASDNPEKTCRTYIGKRIKGAIRRAINIHRGTMKIPEWKLNEVRGMELEDGEYDKGVNLFFSQIFEASDAWEPAYPGQHNPYDIADDSDPYNIDIINKYLLGIMWKYCTAEQYQVLRLSYGLDCPKLSAVEIANFLDMNMSTSVVRVSQIKRDAIHQLKINVKPNELFGYEV